MKLLKKNRIKSKNMIILIEMSSITLGLSLDVSIGALFPKKTCLVDKFSICKLHAVAQIEIDIRCKILEKLYFHIGKSKKEISIFNSVIRA